MSDRGIDFRADQNEPFLHRDQKEYLARHFPVYDQLASVRQVHGRDIWVIDRPDECGRDEPRADGLVTDLPRVALSIRTADCLPVFFYDPQRTCIGLIHAGWQGSRQKIASNAIRVMQRRFRSDPADIMAYFGPGIRPCCYRVGEDFLSFFPEEIQRRDGHPYLDLALVNKNQLVRGGLREQNIFISPVCTCCCEDFFSYRREGKEAGRHLSLIMLGP